LVPLGRAGEGGAYSFTMERRGGGGTEGGQGRFALETGANHIVIRELKKFQRTLGIDRRIKELFSKITCRKEGKGYICLAIRGGKRKEKLSEEDGERGSRNYTHREKGGK